MFNFNNPYGANLPIYNPNLTPQQRLAQMEASYAPQQAQPSNNGFNVIPVTNITEANAYRVDLHGTPTFFFNSGSNEIYMKKTNLQTGAADFFTYIKAETPITNEQVVNTVVTTYEKDFKALNDKIDGLYALLTNKAEQSIKIEPTEKVGKNAK